MNNYGDPVLDLKTNKIIDYKFKDDVYAEIEGYSNKDGYKVNSIFIK